MNSGILIIGVIIIGIIIGIIVGKIIIGKIIIATTHIPRVNIPLENVFINLLPDELVASPYYKSSGAILYFDKDLAQWNNCRMSAEVALCYAYKYKKDFCINLESPGINVFEYYDYQHFQQVVPTCGVNKIQASIRASNMKFTDIDLPSNKNWYFPETARLFAQYTEISTFKPMLDYVTLVNYAFRLKPDIVDSCIDLLKENHLEAFQYIAVHVRRSDFAQVNSEIRHLPHAIILNSIQREMRKYPQVSQLLLVSDEHDQELISKIDKIIKVVCWSNLKKSAIVDMLCCVPAVSFIGTPLSTFTSCIIQWRHRCNTNVGEPVFTKTMRLPQWAKQGELNYPVPTPPNTFKEIGFQKITAPFEISKILQEHLRDKNIPWGDEHDAGVIEYAKDEHDAGVIEYAKDYQWQRQSTQSTPSQSTPSEVKPIPTDKEVQLKQLIQPILERWCGFPLTYNNIYGIRRYHSGSHLIMHVDRENTHIVSVIMNIDYQVKKPWFLHIKNRKGELNKIEIKPTEMVLYASRACEHGRPDTLDGSVVNAFIHFYPENWDSCETNTC